MARFILSHRWTRQPTWPVEIDPDHPLSQGLVACYGVAALGDLSAVTDAVTGRKLANSGLTTNQGTAHHKDGRGLKFAAASTNYFQATSDIPLNLKNATGWSILMNVRPVSGSPGATRAYVTISASSVTHSFLQLAQTSGGAPQLNFTDGSAVSAQVSGSTLVTGVPEWIGFTSNGTNDHRCIHRTVANVTTTSLGSITTSNRFTLGALTRTTTSNYGDGVLIGPWIWNRVLDHREMTRAMSNPWQMFRPLSKLQIIHYGETLPSTGSKTSKLTLLGVG